MQSFIWLFRQSECAALHSTWSGEGHASAVKSRAPPRFTLLDTREKRERTRTSIERRFVRKEKSNGRRYLHLSTCFRSFNDILGYSLQTIVYFEPIGYEPLNNAFRSDKITDTTKKKKSLEWNAKRAQIFNFFYMRNGNLNKKEKSNCIQEILFHFHRKCHFIFCVIKIIQNFKLAWL